MQDRFAPSFLSGIIGAAIPFSSALLAVLAGNVPISLMGGLIPAPLFALMPVYFWCLVRPDLMPPWAAFAIGIAQDLLSGGPPGVWAFAFVACYAFVDRQRDAFAGLAGFGAVLGFAAAMLIASLCAYIAVCVVYARLLPAAPLMLDVGASVFCYVPALWLMNYLQHRFVGPLRSGF